MGVDVARGVFKAVCVVSGVGVVLAERTRLSLDTHSLSLWCARELSIQYQWTKGVGKRARYRLEVEDAEDGGEIRGAKRRKKLWEAEDVETVEMRCSGPRVV